MAIARLLRTLGLKGVWGFCPQSRSPPLQPRPKPGGYRYRIATADADASFYCKVKLLQSEVKSGSLFDRTLGPDLPAMTMDDPLNRGQTNAIARKVCHGV